LYIGYTNDLRKRLGQHNGKLVRSTKPYVPWIIVYYEAYASKSEALKREQSLKLRANAWNQLRRRIDRSIGLNAD
jgi:putative endonuclease